MSPTWLVTDIVSSSRDSIADIPIQSAQLLGGFTLWTAHCLFHVLLMLVGFPLCISHFHWRRRRRRFQPSISLQLLLVYVCACKKVSLFLSSFFSWYQSLVKAKRVDSKQRSHWKWQKGKSFIILFTPLCNPRSRSSSRSYGRNLQIKCCLHRLRGSGAVIQPFGLQFCGQKFVPGTFRPLFLRSKDFAGFVESLQKFCRFKISVQVTDLCGDRVGTCICDCGYMYAYCGHYI